MKLNLNQSPYFDDFDETKNYMRILFRPSFAVQARELTQLQTMLQNQIGKFGSHIFTNGSKVLDAQLSFETNAKSIKITATDLDLDANITNLFSYFSIDTDIISLDELKSIVKRQGYMSTRDGVTGLTFINGDARIRVVAVYPVIDVANPATIVCQELTGVGAANNTTYTASTGKSFTSISTDAVGSASFYTMNSGVFFINGMFVYTDKQTVVTGKYTNAPSIRVGLDVIESIVTANTDQSLLDPARGSTNFNAVGADRYAVELFLTTKAYDNADPIENTSSLDYVEIARIKDGVINAQRDSSTYSELEDTLARRTYDESGDYTVKPFQIQIKDHPTDATKFQVGLDAGSAYIRGYEFRTLSTTWLDLDRSRTTNTTNNELIPTMFGNYVIADSSSGTITGNLPVLSEDFIQLWDATTGGTQIGTARVRQLYRTNATSYRIYLTDVTMTSSSFDLVRSIRYTGGVRWDLVNVGGVTTLNEPSNNVLLFKQNNNNIKDYTSASYNYVKVLPISAGQWTGTGPYTITNISPSVGESFLASDTANGYAPYVVIDSAGTVRTITNVSIGGGGSLTLTISGATNPANSTVYALVRRNTSTARIKTLNTNSVSINAGVGLSSFLLKSGSRNYYDATELVSIFHSASPATDIKSKFKLDSGQTDNYYGVASITWNSADAIPTTGSFSVTFKSFDHSNDALGTGYFTVDSYTNITAEEIPVYSSQLTGKYDLRDVVDFRPTVVDTVGSSLVKNQALPVAFGIGSAFTSDYEFYIARRDIVVLTKDKKFVVVAGIPAVQPSYPNDIADAMTLYGIDVPAYTKNVSDIKSKYIENKRYTMRDIGKLETRIDRVEYYTALSLLEKQAKDSALLTSAGVNAFKNGILVDSFNGHNVGDVSHPEYKCSIDYSKRVLRPKCDFRNIKMQRVSGGVISSDGLVTLPYTTSIFIDQPLASNVINVTPYDTISWVGATKLTPSSDTWYDTATAPDIIVNGDNVNDNWLALNADAVGTVWDAWTTDWVGTTTTRVGFDSATRVETLATVQTNKNSRTGIQTSIGESLTTIVNNKLINTSVIPYMRQITVAFTTKFMKPLTRIYTFFDGVQVNSGVVMTTDEFGEYSGTFVIPANIRTGSKLFTVVDKLPDTGFPTTSSAAQFTSAGTLNTVQSTRMRNFVLTSTTISESETIVGAATTTTRIDPLAESFFVNAKEFPNGMFIDSIDVVFYTKSETLPVMLQVRPMVNGYPSSTDILPLAEIVLPPTSVNVAADPFNPSFNDKTNFKFSSPIYLPVGEYCFVLLATTTEYQVFSAIMGAKQLGSNNVITKQPYIGSLFKSQNASTWTASQEMDIMFRINKCDFDVTTPSSVILSNITTSESTVFPYHLTNAFDCVQEFSSARTQWEQRGVISGGALETTWSGINYDTNIKLLSEYQIQQNLADQLQYRVTLSTTDKNVSPVLDMERCSSMVVKNIVNSDLTNETVTNTGSASAKYLIKKVNLAAGFESVGLSVTFDAYLPSIADVLVYYKTITNGSATNLDNVNWTLLGSSGDSAQTSANRLDTSVQYIEYSLKTDTLPVFDTYVIKLVMIGDGINYPEVKDLRVIAYS